MKNLLRNLKILDFTTLLPGPYATLMLSDMGADVIKISSKSRKDIILKNSVKINNISAAQMWINRNKKTVSLNLKKKESVNIIKKMIMEYDVIIESFTPGVMESFGLSYDDLKKINSKIIYCSISSYGHNNEKSHLSGHDINLMAESGISYMSKNPSLISTQIGGLSAANNAVIGILAAFNYRNLTGKGQFIDISILDSLINLNTIEICDYLASNEEKPPASSLLNGGSLYDYYLTSDNRYIAFGAIEDKFFEKFCNIINRPDLIKGGIFPENVCEVKEDLRNIFKSKNYDYWVNLFKNENICITGVKSFSEIFKSDDVKNRNTVKINDTLELSIPIKFGLNKDLKDAPGRITGSDTYKILKNFGYSDDEINYFEKNDVFK